MPVNKPFASVSVAVLIAPMPNTAELVKLPVAQRLALIDELLASIPDAEFVAETAQVAEARTRLRELKSNPSIGLTYDELKARLG